MEGYQIKEFTIFLWPAFSRPLSPLHLCSDWSKASFTPTETEQVPIFLHLGSDWSEACFTSTEIEHVLNSAMCLQHAFGPQAKIWRTHHTLPVLGFKQQFSQGCKECGLDFSAEWQTVHRSIRRFEPFSCSSEVATAAACMQLPFFSAGEPAAFFPLGDSEAAPSPASAQKVANTALVVLLHQP